MSIVALCLLLTPQAGEPAFDAGAWMARWEHNIVGDSRNRYCDKEMGEEIGWLISPFFDGFYNGYRATHDRKWIDYLVDWADSWISRGIKEPDGEIGWPKAGTGGLQEDTLYTDSLLGEAMALRPIVLMSSEILKDPRLRHFYGSKAQGYIDLANRTFRKWESRGCWRAVAGGGGVWVVPAFGIDQATGKWTDGYARRFTEGFSNPDNKQNAIAEWMLAMFDVTRAPVYRERAEAWWRVMRSRMKLREDGKYFVWNYWDPAGPWDYKPDGSTRHWVGVHPNGGYYAVDVGAIADAHRHGLVFTKPDMDRLIATNRDFMWNQSLSDPKFRRIDGEAADPRWKDSPGLVWTGLVPYDPTLRRIFEQTLNPGSWSGLSAAPWFVTTLAGRHSPQ